MKVIETLGDLRDSNMGLYAHCRARNVGHGRELDLAKLIAYLGKDYVFICDERIGNETVCTHPGCGQRRRRNQADLRHPAGASSAGQIRCQMK